MDFEPYSGYFWQGDIVRLRAPKIEDATKKLREYTDTEARSWLQYGMDLPPISFEAYSERLESYYDFKDTSQMTMFSIETLAGEYVGWLNLFANNQRHGVFSFGISVFREYQRNGYAADALRILLRYGFYQLRMQKCNSASIAINEGSIRLHQKLGSRRKADADERFTLMGSSTMMSCGDCSRRSSTKTKGRTEVDQTSRPAQWPGGCELYV
jgi:RimJ/RimL family protein N-acetyltransferase